VDTNLSFSPQLNTTLTGTYGAIGSSGRFTGALTITFFPTPGTTPGTLTVAFYLIDSSHGFFIETDSLYSGVLSFGTSPRGPRSVQTVPGRQNECRPS
jgi:hypothetical protein